MSEQAAAPTGPRPRPGGRTARIRRQVLEATVRLIADRGAEGLHYDEVARTAGVNRATVHRNWPHRDDLIREALAAFAEASILLPDTDDLEADLTEFVCTMAATARTPMGRALARSLLSTDPSAIRTVGLQLLDERLPALQARIDRAVRHGQLPPLDATLLNELLTGPVQLREARHPGTFQRPDARRLVTIVLAGVRGSPSH